MRVHAPCCLGRIEPGARPRAESTYDSAVGIPAVLDHRSQVGAPTRHVLTAGEVDQVMNGAGGGDALGLRDRAILETLYSTGIRRMELVNLKLYDLDVERGTLDVR